MKAWIKWQLDGTIVEMTDIRIPARTTVTLTLDGLKFNLDKSPHERLHEKQGMTEVEVTYSCVDCSFTTEDIEGALAHRKECPRRGWRRFFKRKKYA